jgi:DNA-directed RNA polymerase specialized sigma24 family protein
VAPLKNSRWDLTPDAFEQLLGWLDPNRDSAGYRYEEIRYRLIRIFARRGCYEAEELADETINRVARKVKEIAPTYDGDPAHYFCGVGQKVYQEYLKEQIKQNPGEPPPSPPREDDELEVWYQCLERCLERLNPEGRDLILRYYEEVKQRKIDYRRQLAQSLGVTSTTLRIRTHRIRGGLEICIRDCIDTGSNEVRPAELQ